MIENLVKFLQKDGTIAEKSKWDIKEFESFDIPILYLIGSIAGMTKDDKVTLSYFWKDTSGTCTLKWQGNSSVTMFQKKNYTIKFDKAFEVIEGWANRVSIALNPISTTPATIKTFCVLHFGEKL